MLHGIFLLHYEVSKEGGMHCMKRGPQSAANRISDYNDIPTCHSVEMVVYVGMENIGTCYGVCLRKQSNS